MLTGETGYEGKFDFALPRAPEQVYLLASVPRTGSSFLSHVLWRTGCLGAPLEYLNFDPAGPYAFASRSPDQQQALWRSLLGRRTSPNGVFGVKCFPMQMQALEEGNRALLSSVMSVWLSGPRPKRVVYLLRRDRIAHSVSYARATLSGVWRSEQERSGAPEVPYSEQAVANAQRWIDEQTGAWEEMFRELAVDPLRLFYEDVTADPDSAARAVASYLGVALDPAAAVDVPAVERQAEADSRAWRERFAAARSD